MDPWELFAFVQQAKAYADLHQFDEAQNFIDEAVKGLERFPVFASHIYDAAGQIKRMQGDPESGKSFEAALNAAEQSGLLLRRQSLLRYMRQNEQGQQQKSN